LYCGVSWFIVLAPEKERKKKAECLNEGRKKKKVDG
jgi:hypothetical protein